MTRVRDCDTSPLRHGADLGYYARHSRAIPMKLRTFLAAPSMPMTTIGFGIISWSIDPRLIDSARFTL